MTCEVENCSDLVIAKSLCQSHYDRNRRYGDLVTRPSTFTCAGCFQEAIARRTGKFPTLCGACMKEKHAKQMLADRRRKGLWESYKLTLDEYDAMYQAQNGLCLICLQKTQGRGAKKNTLAVDHNHQTGKIRGLLCSHCNTGLGLFRDNKELLQKAIDYLNERD